MSTDISPSVRVTRDAAIKHVVIDCAGKRNALSCDIVEALLDAVDSAERDGTRLFTLRGEGKNFSAGFDFSGFEDESEGELVRRFVRIEQLLQRLAHASFDTVAHAHGRNFGAGADLFAVCNRRWAAPGTTFRMPGLGFGLVLGSRRLANIVGVDWARKILHDGVTFNAETALKRGFATNVVTGEEVESQLTEIAKPALTADAAARLFRVLRRDTRDADMAELVASAAAPGLKDRMRAYRDVATAVADSSKTQKL